MALKLAISNVSVKLNQVIVDNRLITRVYQNDFPLERGLPANASALAKRRRPEHRFAGKLRSNAIAFQSGQ
ncbi:hypothetical protein AFK24_15290 [Pseudomonas syringae]|uniref:Uncharacterized protein n=1 Tax=Pseudomonas syringae TaxID=317 RepID=A0A1C7Z586_PSESX|nr:hypothetical protein AFK24_15290 [Pseudomonas syringae]